MKLFVLLILAVFASEKKENAENCPANGNKIETNEENSIFVKIEEDEYAKVNIKSKFIGVTHNKNFSKQWKAQRWSKKEKTMIPNGCYDDEETAAHASDTLARILMANGGEDQKLNFPDDYTKVYPEKASKFIGVTYNKKLSKWRVQRWGNKMFSNGYYDDEETAAHASDTLARQLMNNGELKLKLNFPEDYTKVYPEKESKYIGVTYNKEDSKWYVRRWSKNKNNNVSNGVYDDEVTAAHASDNLARKLMENGDQKLKLNFPDDHIEVYKKKKTSKFVGVNYNEKTSKWRVLRWNKNEKKMVYNGYYIGEETAAHASDTLARKLMEKGDLKVKLNFSDDFAEVYSAENQNKKRKRTKGFGLGHTQNN